jgi:hypothetical protein
MSVKNIFMKKFLFILLLNTAVAKAQKTYYVATNGNDNNTGTLNKPFATWEKGASVLKAGDILYIRGGVYRCTKTPSTASLCSVHNLAGTSAAPITISTYPGEKPIFDVTDKVWTNSGAAGVDIVNCSWLKIYGLKVAGPKQYMPVGGLPTSDWCWGMSGCNNIIIENSEATQGMYGFGIENSSNILFRNCDAHELYNPFGDTNQPSPGDIHYPYGGATGFACTGNNTSTNITYKACRAYWCSDNGFATFGTDGSQNFDSCWAFNIGYREDHITTGGDGMGFKLGPTETDKSTTVLHTLTNCVAFNNRVHGFIQNEARCVEALYNCTAYNNGGNGFKFGDFYPTIHHILKNNIDYQNPLGTDNSCCGSGWVQSNNSWNGHTVTRGDFITLDTTGVSGPRQTNGNLPALNFLHLSPTSKLSGLGAFPPITPTIVHRNALQSEKTDTNDSTNDAASSVAGTVSAEKYISTFILFLIGVAFHIVQKILLLRQTFSQFTWREISKTFFNEEWDSLVATGFVLVVCEMVLFVFMNNEAKRPHCLEHLGMYITPVVLGYFGHRIAYKYLATTERVLKKKLNKK